MEPSTTSPPPPPPPPFHEDPELCRYLLGRITTAHPLRIVESRTPGAGSGLVTTRPVDAGEELFRQTPLASSVHDDLHTVCDFCYANSAARITPEGRFRTKADAVSELVVCDGCRVCKYCSKECREKARVAYHQYECASFATKPQLQIRERVLHRILVWREKGLFTEQDWRSLTMLLSHPSEDVQNEDRQAELHRLTCDAQAATGSRLPLGEIKRIYGAILTNSMAIRQPGQSNPLGTAVYVVGAMMNHSCEPNALISFHGRELRVRALRPLQAGDELVHCYTDVQSDVLLRQTLLRDDYFFTCSCARCADELAAHERVTGGDVDKLERIRQTQNTLFAVMNQAVADFGAAATTTTTTTTKTVPLDVDAVAERLEDVADAAHPDGYWPDGLEPLPSVRKTLGRLGQASGRPVAGLRHSLRGCAHTTRRLGEPWMVDLFELVQILTAVLARPPPPAKTRDDDDDADATTTTTKNDKDEDEDEEDNEEEPSPPFPDPRELWDVFHGYLGELRRVARVTCGSEAGYARAVGTWYDAALKYADEPRPGTPGFDERFRAAHRKLLAWAEVDGEWEIAASSAA